MLILTTLQGDGSKDDVWRVVQGYLTRECASLSGIPDKAVYQEIRIIRKSSFAQVVTALVVCDDRRDFIG